MHFNKVHFNLHCSQEAEICHNDVCNVIFSPKVRMEAFHLYISVLESLNSSSREKLIEKTNGYGI